MEILAIREHEEFIKKAAAWFHEKWGIPAAEYQKSMDACRSNKGSIPQWYIAVEKNRIIGGIGVIENDFHDRPDLTPNICALYVEQDYRCHGLAGRLLRHVCRDMRSFGIRTLYLVTEHNSFYERYGWKFLCMVNADGEDEQLRLYVYEHMQ